ncbi:MAG: P-loop NTPase [bacterium]
MITKDKVLMSLRGVKEPNLQKDLIQMNLVDIHLDESNIKIEVYLKEEAMDKKDEIEEKIKNKVYLAFGQEVRSLQVDFIKVEDYSQVKKRKVLNVVDSLKAKIGKVIAITSGKGGVGKSTVAINLAISLKDLGFKVGLLDCDVYGPSIPTAFGLEGYILQIKDEKILPAEKFGMKMVSIGFMIPQVDTPLIWRGPMLHKAINEMVNNVEWGNLDYLVVDLPPGTGDAILSLNSSVKIDGAIVVSTSQRVSTVDVAKNINMLKTLSIPIIGIIENMSYVQCSCGEKIYLWGREGVKSLATKYEIPYLGEIPFFPEIVESMEYSNFIKIPQEAKKIYQKIAKQIVDLSYLKR